MNDAIESPVVETACDMKAMAATRKTATEVSAAKTPDVAPQKSALKPAAAELEDKPKK